MTTLIVERARPGWGFGLRWIVANIGGLSIGYALGMPLLFFAFMQGFLGDHTMRFEAYWAVGAAIVGAVSGTTQWFMLRRYVTHAWILISVFGYVVGAYASVLVGLSVTSGEMQRGTPFVEAAIAGTVIGITQWLALRRHVAAAFWWVLASAAAFAVGAFSGFTAGAVVGANAHSWGAVVLWGAVFGAAGGILYVSITGIALVWLLRHSFERPALEATPADARAV
jgi:hypothetical protein